jgi:short-subunit dehydrogenase
MDIGGRTIVVTGASRGIGLASGKALVRAGGRVALLARSPSIETIATDLEAASGTARGYRVDVTDAAAVDRVKGRIVADLGDPSIVINNAGSGRFLSVEETPPAELVAQMAAPYFAAFYVTRAFLPAMLDRRSGYIVNVTSPAAWFTWPGADGYIAARWAMRGFTQALRAEMQNTGVKVMLLAPAKVSSTYFESNPNSEERLPAITRTMPTLTPEYVADALVHGIENDRHRLVIPARLDLMLLGLTLAPALMNWMMWRSSRWRRQAGEVNL